ncbi:unnamed protein product [Microthlaspi erraticum]|uniref:Dof zinc finger protein n=1 Tax=Microthlaspi erraticum TaxID=1685480 RepID=A0A6D2L030_9BRAS|nr:unnamed protein product [Microthlaspi erraticum]
MDNSNVHGDEVNQVNEEKHPPRVCPRCNSDNTKFCYYNNYSLSQPRYFCKNCRRYWTHGGALRNIPIGGSCRKAKRQKMDHPSVSQLVSVETEQVNHHQPLFSGGSSSASPVVAVGNHFGSLHEIHGDMVLPVRSFGQVDRLDFSNGSFQQDYYDVGSNDLIGNPLVNQTIGRHFDNYNGYSINQEDQNKRNQSFNNIMSITHIAGNGSRGFSSTPHMNKNNNNIINNCLFMSSYHLEKHGL